MTSDEMRQHLEMLLADSQARHKDIELLYESITGLRESITGLRQTAAKHDEQIATLIESGQRTDQRLNLLIRAVEGLAGHVEQHATRLDRLEKP